MIIRRNIFPLVVESTGSLQEKTQSLLSETEVLVTSFLANQTRVSSAADVYLNLTKKLESRTATSLGAVLALNERTESVSSRVNDLRIQSEELMVYGKSIHRTANESVANWESYWSGYDKTVEDSYVTARELLADVHSKFILYLEIIYTSSVMIFTSGMRVIAVKGCKS